MTSDSEEGKSEDTGVETPAEEGNEAPPDEFTEPADQAVQNEMDELMDQYLNRMKGALESGQMIRVPIVAVHRDHVLVDVGDKAEGIIPIEELTLPGGEMPLKPGDELDAVVKGHDRETGLLNLSHSEARRRVAMGVLEEASRTGEPVEGVVREVVKGGLLVDVGATAFMPASQVDLRRIEDFEPWVGKQVKGVILEFLPAKRRIIFSRRKFMENERDVLRKEVLSRIKVGDAVTARVKKIVDFGVFVDLGGIDGLVPRVEVSWQRNSRPEDYFKQDEETQVKVIEINERAGKITLSRRRTLPDPWEGADERFATGQTVRGTIASITSYGAFVRLEEGLDGMIHISDMAWDSAGKRPGDFLATGQEVEASVLNVDVEKRRMSLGLKQLTSDPWAELAERHPIGSRVKGKVSGMTKYGAFVEIEPGIEGMVHVSDFSWDKRVSQPRDVVTKGDEIEACVLSVDVERRRIALGVKQLSESPLTLFTVNHKVGDNVEGEVSNVTDFGVFLKLAEGIEGFIHVSQLDTSRVDSPASVCKTGDKLEAQIMKIDVNDGKIGLSRKIFLKKSEKRVVAEYMKTSSHGGQSMGELLAEISLEDDLPRE